MHKRNIMISSLTLAAAVTPAAAQKQQSRQEASVRRPNIVYIMTDDHSQQTISAYGSRLNTTPNIDRIAGDGMVLRNNFVTNSISGPCRAVVLTGKFSHKNGFRDNAPETIFDGSQQTFPKLLQTAGYQTAITGKWHLGSAPTGFDYYCIHEGQGNYYSPNMIEQGDTIRYGGAYATDLTLEKSIEWLEQADSTKPFCLMMHFKAPHRNWMPSPEKMALYEDVTFPIPQTFYDDYTGRRAAAEQTMSIAKDMLPGWDMKLEGVNDPDAWLEMELGRMTPEQRDAFNRVYHPIREEFLRSNLTGRELAEWKYQRYLRDYLKAVSSVDDMVGQMIDYLQANGLWENTIVVYTSDQGFYMGEHGWFDKRFMYEESFHTPFIVSYPAAIRAGVDCEALTQNIDIAPTFLDFAGLDIPSDIQGESLKPLLTGDVKQVREDLYYHYYEFPEPHAVKRHYGIRNDRYKLIHFYDDIDVWELYDLARDPQELHNVADDPAYIPVRTHMEERLKALQAKYDDTNPTAVY